ncbi:MULTISPECIES: histidine kinase [unclassified Streptomyces]|uniref:sensor histidine kinase n=1 Tax=unclassified Streptomyces TaxID=2593676 RepID=UPI0006F75A46|nr:MULTISPECIES: histidine kinase [unclassified Streptomyces]KQX56355.1 histidine kinase [Streptomyces sp. Root1304]KRA97169.1 histidine kinase [Streptomyces sp. Root66D1]
MRGDEQGGAVAHLAIRRSAGVLLGCLTALLGAGYFLVAGAALGAFLLWPRTRAYAREVLVAGARRLAAVERGRRAVFFGDRFPEERVPGAYEVSDLRLLRYLAARSWTGLVCGVVLGLLAFGAVLAGLLARGVVRGTLGWDELLTQLLLGGVLLFLDVQGLYALTALDARLARAFFGPSEAELLRRRITELAVSRAQMVQAVDAERRRIERDLHDGVQQRLVALAMLLGRARRGRERDRDPELTGVLLLQAHQEAQDVLAELRDVAWRVYPSALDSLGLEEALGGVAQRCAIPLRVRFEIGDAPLPRPVETAAYFVVSEAVTNAAKHSSASAVAVRLTRTGALLTVRVEDDGTGGADPSGGGLTGLRSRVAALDGVLRVDSPVGGPTTLVAELPCV